MSDFDDFEDFIEYVYDDPYDYIFRQYILDATNPESLPRRIASGRQREQREKLDRQNPVKYEKQTTARALEYSRKNQDHKKVQQQVSREPEKPANNQQNANMCLEYSPQQTEEQLSDDENHKLQIKKPRKIGNRCSTKYEPMRVIDELRENIKEMRKNYNCLQSKYNMQQKKIVKLEETCENLKSELKTLKVQNVSENTESNGDIEMLDEYDNSPNNVKVKEDPENDPLRIIAQCNTSNEEVEESAKEGPISFAPECNASTHVKVESDIFEEHPIS